MKSSLLFIYGLFSFSNIYAANGLFMVVKGDVKLIINNQPAQIVKVGTKVNQGDTVQTGAESRAKIVMSDRNIINISPNTKLKIEEYTNETNAKNVKLSLLEGKVRTNVEQKYDNKKNKFQIQTPTAVAGVRGTQFITIYDGINKKTEVITLQGQVEFKNISTAGQSDQSEKTVLIEKGEKSEVGSNGQAPLPPEKIPKEDLKEYDRDTNIKNKETSQIQNAPPVPSAVSSPPKFEKPPLVDGAIRNKYDKTKIKVEPKPPTESSGNLNTTPGG